MRYQILPSTCVRPTAVKRPPSASPPSEIAVHAPRDDRYTGIFGVTVTPFTADGKGDRRGRPASADRAPARRRHRPTRPERQHRRIPHALERRTAARGRDRPRRGAWPGPNARRRHRRSDRGRCRCRPPRGRPRRRRRDGPPPGAPVRDAGGADRVPRCDRGRLSRSRSFPTSRPRWDPMTPAGWSPSPALSP